MDRFECPDCRTTLEHRGDRLWCPKCQDNLTSIVYKRVKVQQPPLEESDDTVYIPNYGNPAILDQMEDKS